VREGGVQGPATRALAASVVAEHDDLVLAAGQETFRLRAALRIQSAE
jgi:hypothetical protein